MNGVQLEQMANWLPEVLCSEGFQGRSRLSKKKKKSASCDQLVNEVENGGKPETREVGGPNNEGSRM